MSGIGDVLKSVAPTLATALGGPLAGAAVAFLSSKLGVPAEAVQQAVSGMTPADLVKMKELDYQFQEEMGRQGISLQLAQIDVNKEEAKSVNWFVAGARPAIMWICATALAYAAIIEPFARFTAKVIYHYTGDFPIINTDLTMQVMFGVLGLGLYRSAEKIKGAEGNR